MHAAGHGCNRVRKLLCTYRGQGSGCKNFSSQVRFSRREKLIRTLSRQQAIKAGRPLADKEMRMLVEQLFLCSVPNATPDGTPTYVEYQLGQLEKMFGK